MDQYIDIKERALKLFEQANIILTRTEKDSIEIVDFGLGKIGKFGLQIITYVNTEKVCAKELVLLPNQVCPEHKHPKRKFDDGKEETFRCRYGKVYLYVGEEQAGAGSINLPKGEEKYFTATKEVILYPGDQYTIFPNTLHWFKADKEGAVVSEFSTKSTHEDDLFTDPRICRSPITF